MKKYMKFIEAKYAEYIRDLTALGNPIVLLIISLLVLGFNEKFGFVIIGLIVNETVGSMIKFFFHKPRPNGQKFTHSLEKIDAGSFPSIHSSRTSFVYLTLLFNSPELLYKYMFGALIIVVGYSRVFLKKHFFVDVMGGYIFGSILFYLFNFILQ